MPGIPDRLREAHPSFRIAMQAIDQISHTAILSGNSKTTCNRRTPCKVIVIAGFFSAAKINLIPVCRFATNADY